MEEATIEIMTTPDEENQQFVENTSWFLHHDNATSHTAIILREFFATTGHIVPQPSYSPDLAPADFWLFNKLKRLLRGHRFDTIEEIEAAATKSVPRLHADTVVSSEPKN
uniref:DDE_3 domain-containing protein n=1 Tax=Anopheles minimus TaxID=112268 RepID=A0A182VT42_9DIPT